MNVLDTIGNFFEIDGDYYYSIVFEGGYMPVFKIDQDKIAEYVIQRGIEYNPKDMGETIEIVEAYVKALINAN